MRKTYLLLLVILTAGLVMVLPVRSEATTFVIDRADATNTLSLSGSTTLNAFINNVSDRFVLEFANASNTLLITPPPLALTTAIDNVADRFVMEFANASNTLPIAYPEEMIQDTRQPILTNSSVTQVGGTTIITLTTNEFTTSLLEYGTSSGSYLNSLEDNLFRYAHVFELNGLVSGQTYYYRARLTDRGGNESITSEQSFTVNKPLFMPIVTRP